MPTESPTSKLNPQPVRSSSKWRVSFSDSGPLRRRLTRIRAGNGFAREYGVADDVGGAARVADAWFMIVFSGDLLSSQIPFIAGSDHRGEYDIVWQGEFFLCHRQGQ